MALPSCAQTGVVRAARQAQHVVRDVAHVLAAAHRRGHRRHLALAALGDGLDDRLRRAAVQPVAVGQVREALAAARVGAVALRAVVEEQALADAHRAGVLGQLLGRHRHVLGVDRRHRRLGLGLLGLALAGAASTSACRRGCPGPGRAPGRSPAKTTVMHEQPHPPARQRVVQLAQVLVPDVAGGVVVGHHARGGLAIISSTRQAIRLTIVATATKIDQPLLKKSLTACSPRCSRPAALQPRP